MSETLITLIMNYLLQKQQGRDNLLLRSLGLYHFSDNQERSPRIRRANCISLGKIVTLLA